MSVAKDYVSLTLLKYGLVVPNSLAVNPYPSHFALTRCAASQHATSAATTKLSFGTTDSHPLLQDGTAYTPG